MSGRHVPGVQAVARARSGCVEVTSWMPSANNNGTRKRVRWRTLQVCTREETRHRRELNGLGRATHSRSSCRQCTASKTTMQKGVRTHGVIYKVTSLRIGQRSAQRGIQIGLPRGTASTRHMQQTGQRIRKMQLKPLGSKGPGAHFTAELVGCGRETRDTRDRQISELLSCRLVIGGP